MDFKMFDVEHGFCALVTTDDYDHILIECGHNGSTGFTPTEYLLRNEIHVIDELWISNYDEDHISDLANLASEIRIETLWRNKSVSAETLEDIKTESGPLTENMEALLEMIRNSSDGTLSASKRSHDDNILYNAFPTFTDTNNLSALYFLFYRDIRIAYGGDLERKGWENLLKKERCQRWLGQTNIFIASHHGRASGYCPEIFDYCHPDVILISDKEIVHATQQHEYGQHASGVYVDGEKRYVLTTRKDGRIGIRQDASSPRRFYVG